MNVPAEGKREKQQLYPPGMPLHKTPHMLNLEIFRTLQDGLPNNQWMTSPSSRDPKYWHWWNSTQLFNYLQTSTWFVVLHYETQVQEDVRLSQVLLNQNWLRNNNPLERNATCLHPNPCDDAVRTVRPTNHQSVTWKGDYERGDDVRKEVTIYDVIDTRIVVVIWWMMNNCLKIIMMHMKKSKSKTDPHAAIGLIVLSST